MTNEELIADKQAIQKQLDEVEQNLVNLVVNNGLSVESALSNMREATVSILAAKARKMEESAWDEWDSVAKFRDFNKML